MYQPTKALKKIRSLKKRIKGVQGGTSASKTISILMIEIDYAQSHKGPGITSIVSESMPHLKKGALRDFKNIMQTHGYWRDANWNATDSIYTFETGWIIEFFSVDQPDKVRGPRRDRLFGNECNNWKNGLETFNQLEVRTKDSVYLDWNPSSDFWFYTDVLNARDDVDHIIVTYKDNEALPIEIVQSIESRRHNKNWWKVYGEGQLGEVEGRVYTGWTVIDSLPPEARFVRRGLDYGYSNDPTAIVGVYEYNGGYILDEELYRKGLSNKLISDFILNSHTPQMLVVPDSSEPKSNDELRSYGIALIPAQKGPDSVNQGIQLIQGLPIMVTKRSTNLLKEYRNYMWKVDRDGRILNTPEDMFNHCFAPETLIATTEGELPIASLVGRSGYLISRDGQIRHYHSVRPTRYNAELVNLTFDDNRTLSVTPDHLLLQPDGTWKEAGLFNTTDLIQSATYGTNVQWKDLPALLWRKVFKQGNQATSSCSLGALLWPDTKRLSCPPQGFKFTEQQYKQFGVEDSWSASTRSHDTRAPRESEQMGRSNTSSNQEVAFIRRGQGVAQVTWQKSGGTTRGHLERMRSLSLAIRNQGISIFSAFLSSKLQNESTTKTVVRITRGRVPVTYNLEVEGTHCLLADGVIAHNSMDAARYAIQSLNPYYEEEEFDQSVVSDAPLFADIGI